MPDAPSISSWLLLSQLEKSLASVVQQLTRMERTLSDAMTSHLPDSLRHLNERVGRLRAMVDSLKMQLDRMEANGQKVEKISPESLAARVPKQKIEAALQTIAEAEANGTLMRAAPRDALVERMLDRFDKMRTSTKAWLLAFLLVAASSGLVKVILGLWLK